ncbi:MAG: phosphatase PAP2 family protein [bacterium]
MIQIKKILLNKALPILITILSIFLYFPVNRFISGGTNLETIVDKYIPLIPVFVIPYLFGLLFWFSTIVIVNLKADKSYARKFNIVVIVASVLSVIIYLVIPTFVIRPEITGTDFFSSILNLVYSNDRVNNAAPSGHTFYTLLCSLGLYRIFPKQKYLWIIISILIISSTVFTKQHNIMDVVLGLLFGLVIYRVVNRK